jgi:1,4-alpha-glucan branching enzyme
MQWINEEIQKRFTGKISIAEDLKNDVWISKDKGARGAGLSSQWDSEFVHPLGQAIISHDDNLRDLGAVNRAIEHRNELGL